MSYRCRRVLAPARPTGIGIVMEVVEGVEVGVGVVEVIEVIEVVEVEVGVGVGV